MPDTLRITVFENRRPVLTEVYSEPVELGRQDKDDEEIYRGRLKDGVVRIPIVGGRETAVARRQVVVEALPGGRARVSNQSTGVHIRFVEEKSDLKHDSSRDVPLPVTLRIDTREVRIEAVQLQSLAEAPAAPGAAAPPDHSILNTIAADRSPEGESLIPWLQATMDVLHGAAVSSDCFGRAASALVEMIGLDAGRVLMLEGDEWIEKALKIAPHRAGRQPANPPWKPSTWVLSRLRDEKRTFWQVPLSRSESISGVQALVAAPILDRQGRVIGALYGDRGEEGDSGPRAWDPITRLQAMLVQLLASGVAAGLAQKKYLQMERDLEIGRKIQAEFLPKELPQVPGWEIAAHFRPAHEISGDFYDAFALPGGHIALVIADVCDKGVGAGLYMSLIRTMLRAFAEQAVLRQSPAPSGPPSTSPGAVSAAVTAGLIARQAVELTNTYVYRSNRAVGTFCTLFFGVLDVDSGALTYINAGHDIPVLIGTSGSKVHLGTKGTPMGITPDIQYETGEVLLGPGDTLFTYTDGVTEARGPAGKFFGKDVLPSILERPIPSATAIIDDVSAGLHDYIAGAEPHDDVTMLAVRRLP